MGRDTHGNVFGLYLYELQKLKLNSDPFSVLFRRLVPHIHFFVFDKVDCYSFLIVEKLADSKRGQDHCHGNQVTTTWHSSL